MRVKKLTTITTGTMVIEFDQCTSLIAYNFFIKQCIILVWKFALKDYDVGKGVAKWFYSHLRQRTVNAGTWKKKFRDVK